MPAQTPTHETLQTHQLEDWTSNNYFLMESRINLDNIFFTQRTVRSNFRDGQSIHDSNSHISKPLRVTKYKGKIYALDNRTSYSKTLNGHKKTYVDYVPYNQCKSEFQRKKTGNG